MNTITFQHIDYKAQEIELYDLGNVLISTASLNHALMKNGSDYVSEEAKKIDEKIYFFVEDEEFDLAEGDLVKIISSQLQ